MALAIAFPPVRRLKVAQQVAEHLRDAILGGRIRPGDPLPSERELAEQLGVNRSSVREAVLRLESWGLVEIRQGGSTRVTDFLITAGFQLLPYLVAPEGRLDPNLLVDLLELRTMLLGWTAARAADRATPEDVARLRAALSALEAATDGETRQARDFDFFEALELATHNQVLGMLARAVRQVYMENGALFLALYQGDRFDCRHHREAVEAVGRGDGAGAARAMERHGQRAAGVGGGDEQ
jgi:GntR family transcriptional regulator, transcriptional repressor for pyruvate dehydrogenase complex